MITNPKHIWTIFPLNTRQFAVSFLNILWNIFTKKSTMLSRSEGEACIAGGISFTARPGTFPAKGLPAPGGLTAPRKAPCIPGTLVKFSWEI